jgi:ABC-type glutathione transport system ATPase component
MKFWRGITNEEGSNVRVDPSTVPLLGSSVDVDDYKDLNDDQDWTKIEKINVDSKRVGVKMQRLRKTFNREGMDPLIAVNNISIDVYEDQVLALLGHNGKMETDAI